MSAFAFGSALSALGMSPAEFGALPSVQRHERTVTRWLYGEVPVPAFAMAEAKRLVVARNGGIVGV